MNARENNLARIFVHLRHFGSFLHPLAFRPALGPIEITSHVVASTLPASHAEQPPFFFGPILGLLLRRASQLDSSFWPIAPVEPPQSSRAQQPGSSCPFSPPRCFFR